MNDYDEENCCVDGLTWKEYYNELSSLRKHNDIMITRRAALFATANTILFFVFRSGDPNVDPCFIKFAFFIALLFNALWLLANGRSWGFQGRATRELRRLEEETRSEGFRPYLKSIYRGDKLRHRVTSVTTLLCIFMPSLFLLAWVGFFAIYFW